MSFDKYKACKDLDTGEDCPDRVLGCHSSCNGYKCRCQKQKEIKNNRKASIKVPTAHHVKVSQNYYKKHKK